MGEEEATAGIVRVFVGVSIPVMRAMVTSPPDNGPLPLARAHNSEPISQWRGCLVRFVGPETVVAYTFIVSLYGRSRYRGEIAMLTCCDSHASCEVEDSRQQKRPPLKRDMKD